MSKPLSEIESLTNRTGQVVLFGLSGTANEVWRRAAADCEMICLRVEHLDACAAYGVGPIPTVFVATEATFDPGLASRIDSRFRRTTLIISSDNDQLLDLWRWVAWNAAATGEEAASIRAKLADALAEAAERVEEWDRYADFKEREASLSPEEHLVLVAVCQGRLNKQIAADLNVSIRTVEQRRRRVFDKMGVESAVPLAARIARVKTLDDRIAREQGRESRLRSINRGTAEIDSAIPKVSAPKPKFTGGFLSADTPIPSSGY